MQNLLRVEYEKILLLASIISRGDYPTTMINNQSEAMPPKFKNFSGLILEKL